jgi:hypothetical protein
MARMLEGVGQAGVDLEVDETQQPIDRYRLALIGFVTEHWQKIQTQITCPMRELPTNPRPCFGCLDTQVMACVVTNRDNEPKIRLHLPTLKDEK